MLSKVPRKKGEALLPWSFVVSREDRGAFEAVYRVPIGYSYLDLERQIDALYAACGAPVELKDYAGAVLIRVLREDFPACIPYTGQEAAGKKDIILGYDRQGEPIIHSLRVPHLLIAGKSGYGKTDLIRWILFQLIAKNTPDEIEIWIVDLKGFSFLPFKKIPHITRIARDIGSASVLLSDAVKEMKNRSNEIWESGDRSKAGSYKQIYVLIDEAYMIAPKVVGKDEKLLAKVCDEAAAKISGTGREARLGLFYCTQRPDADVINPLVKANMDCKICFKTETESNSEIVLDRKGAERLPDGKPGRILYSRDGLIECQVPFIGGDEEWDTLLQAYGRNEDGGERQDTDASKGDTAILDGTGGEILFDEWKPVQTGERDPQETGTGGLDRGTPPGDRQAESMASVLDWTKIFRR